MSPRGLQAKIRARVDLMAGIRDDVGTGVLIGLQ
jgi:hypothetical protein